MSLCHGDKLEFPFEVYHSNPDSSEKTSWYAINKINVIKIDVSRKSGVRLDDIKDLRKDWETNRDPHVVFDKLKMEIIRNNPKDGCLAPYVITTKEMLNGILVCRRRQEEDQKNIDEKQKRLAQELYESYIIEEKRLLLEAYFSQMGDNEMNKRRPCGFNEFRRF